MKRPFRLTHAFFPTACVLVACGDFDHANIITIAFAGVVNAELPMIGVSMRKQAHSYALMNRFGEFTVNIPHDRMLREVDVCGMVSGGETDKFDYTRLTKKASVKGQATAHRGGDRQPGVPAPPHPGAGQPHALHRGSGTGAYG